MRYRRVRMAGASYFFTVVTLDRRPIFSLPKARMALRTAIREEWNRRPFRIDAVVLLPDHLHCVWTLPEGDVDFPGRWRRIKAAVTRAVANEVEAPPAASRKAKGERGVWQRRYWEHLIRDERDFTAHVGYIHYNPVRHGLVQRASDWPWSSFDRYVAHGIYPPEWGERELRFPDSVGRE